MTDESQQEESLPAGKIDAFNTRVGHAASWLCLAMVAVTLVIVLLRYAFDLGFIWLQEALTWMHAAVFMLGAAYTFRRDEHVRVDVFYRKMSEGQQAWVNALGVIVFVFPLCAFFVIEAYEYVASAWRIREVSRDTGGLPYPAIPMLKSLLVVMPLLVALQGLAVLLQAVRTIRSGEAQS